MDWGSILLKVAEEIPAIIGAVGGAIGAIKAGKALEQGKANNKVAQEVSAKVDSNTETTEAIHDKVTAIEAGAPLGQFRS